MRFLPCLESSVYYPTTTRVRGEVSFFMELFYASFIDRSHAVRGTPFGTVLS